MAIAQHSKKSNSHMTPGHVVGLVHQVMGGIDLDPATTQFANRLVKAKRYYDYSTNGLNKRWEGRVFLNPPGGVIARPLRRRDIDIGYESVTDTHSRSTIWWAKLLHSWLEGAMSQGVFVGFSLEFLRHAQRISKTWTPLDFPYCIPEDRLRFDRLVRSRKGKRRVAGAQPTNANIIVYLPEKARDVVRFQKVFHALGVVRAGSAYEPWFWRARERNGRKSGWKSKRVKAT
jgi:hypothetical protein